MVKMLNCKKIIAILCSLCIIVGSAPMVFALDKPTDKLNYPVKMTDIGPNNWWGAPTVDWSPAAEGGVMVFTVYCHIVFFKNIFCIKKF